MNTQTSTSLMTSGPIWQRIISFAIPLFFGNLFQQLYNTADSLIVGNFLGSNALAAVSSSGNLIFLMVGFFNGLAVGAGVVVAKYFGAKNYEMMKKTIRTIIALGLISGVVLTAIGLIAAPRILLLMGTPENILPNSISYFRIYFCGSIAFVMYNFLVGILQSMGDSKHPLIFLIISSIVNVVLDLVFVAVFHWDVAGVAWATFIAQGASGVLAFFLLLRRVRSFDTHGHFLFFSAEMLRRLTNYAVPSIAQQSFVSVGNVIIQYYVNLCGATVIAGGLFTLLLGAGLWAETAVCRIVAGRDGNEGAWHFDWLTSGAVLLNFSAASVITLATAAWTAEWKCLICFNLFVWSFSFANGAAALRIGLTRFADVRPRHAIWLSAVVIGTLVVAAWAAWRRWLG